jgi:5-hydroxyisourate hydrolase-like protein (transthyretin family)
MLTDDVSATWDDIPQDIGMDMNSSLRNAMLSRKYDEDALDNPFAGAYGGKEQYTEKYSSYPQSANGREAVPVFESQEEYFRENPAVGELTVHVLTAETRTPISGAAVLVAREIGGKYYKFAEHVTNRTGTVSEIPLPTPAKDFSFDPGHDHLPYAVYDIYVTAGNRKALYRNATLFPDIESVQTVYVGAENSTVDESQYQNS